MLLLLVCGLYPAYAREVDEANGASITPAMRAETRFQEAVRLYALREYHRARIEFRAAYALNPLVDLLHNESMAAEGEGDLRGALDLERRYLAGISDRTAIDEAKTRIATLAAMVARDELVKPPLPIAVSEPASRHSYTAPGVLLALGSAAVLAGLGTTAASAVQNDTARNPLLPDDYRRVTAEGYRLNLASYLLIPIGGAMLAGGAVWLGVVHAKRKK